MNWSCRGITSREEIRACVILFAILMLIHFQLLHLEETTDPLQSDQRPAPWLWISPCNYSTPPRDIHFAPNLIWNNETMCSCPPKTPKTLAVIVNSGRPNFDRRSLIRETWGGLKNVNGWTILAVNFMVGNKGLKEATKVGKQLTDEWSNFGDLTMGNFTDTYRNLTLKTIMGYKWLSEYCGHVAAVIKCDDDVILNLYQLTDILNKNPAMWVNSSNYYGDVHKGTGPVRDPRHRWYVSKEEYPSRWYPQYVSGFGQLLTIEVVNKCLGQLDGIKHTISMDDIFMAGIVPQRYNDELKKTKEDKKGQTVERLKLNKGKWHFNGNIPKWSSDYNVTEKEQVQNVQYPIFYIIKHGKKFKEDFTKVWKKLEWLFTYSS